MGQSFRVFRQFIRSSFTRELEFRGNFIAKILQNIIWMLFFLLILKVVYLNTGVVAGWKEGDAYILSATCFLMLSIVNGFFTYNLIEIPEKVRKGTLDFDLVKPIDTQLLVSIRKVRFDEIGTFLVGIVMVMLGTKMGGHVPSAWNVFSYLFLIPCAIVIFYNFSLMLMTLGIWLVRVDNLWVLSDSIFVIARFPLDIFGPTATRVLTFFVPLAFISTVPSQALLGRLAPEMALWGIGWAAAFALGGRAFFRFALRHYTSASS